MPDPGAPAAAGVTWAYPIALALLGLLPVIAWLHLRRRPGPETLVPSLAVWQAVARRAAVRRRAVPPTVLLALHLAAASALALAAADPRPDRGPGGGGLVVLLDTSLSMRAGDRWQAALDAARDAFGGVTGPVSLVTMGPEPRALVWRGTDAATVDGVLRSIEPGGVGNDVAEATALARLAGGAGAVLVAIGDPAMGRFDDDVRTVTVGRPEENIAVVAARARVVDGRASLFARVASFAAETRDVAIRVLVDGREVAVEQATLAPGGTHEAVWTLPEIGRWAEIRLGTADALPDDDTLTVPVEETPIVVQAIGIDGAVAAALDAMPGVVVSRVGPGTYTTDGSAQVTVAVGQAPEVEPPGGLVVFGGAGRDGDATTGSDAASADGGRQASAAPEGDSAAVRSIGDHAIARGLDLFGARLGNAQATAPPPWAEGVLETDQGVAAYAGTSGSRRTVVFAFDPDQGDIARRLAFPVLVGRAVQWAAGERYPAVSPAGRALRLPDGATRVLTPRSDEAVVGGSWVEWLVPGPYEVRLGGRPDARVLRIGVQAGDIAESDLRAASSSPGEVSTATAPRGARWASVLVAAALGALGLEAAWRGGRRPPTAEAT